MKGVIHKFYCDIYNTKFTVCFNRFTFCKRFSWDILGDFSAGTCWIEGSKSINIFIDADESFLNISDVCHESFHAADYVFDRAGMIYNPQSGNEHAAYLIGWISKKISECYNIEVQNKAP